MSQPPYQHSQPTVIYVTPANTAPPPAFGAPQTIVVKNSRWRNRPQSNATALYTNLTKDTIAEPIALATDSNKFSWLVIRGLIFLSAGMNMAMGAGWAQYGLYGSLKHFCFSWFIGVIIGTILSAPLRNFVKKKFLMAASSVLILLGGILFTSSPYDYDSLISARYINGIAIGLAIVPYLLNASEIAVDCNRGFCLAMEQYSVTFGIAVQMIYASYWTYGVDFPANRLHGIIDIVCGVLAVGMCFYFIESPIEHINNSDDGAALDSLARLRNPQGITLETHAWLEELKTYVREHGNLTMAENLSRGILPLMKMMIFRSLMLAFCFSLPLSYALQYSILINNSGIWAATVAAFARILGSLIAITLVDKVGRKLPSVISVLIVGSLLIGLATLFQNLVSILNSDDMYAATSLYIFIQFAAGFYAPYTSIYMAEAFPMRIKPYFMDICVISEQLIHIIFITTISLYIGDSLMTQGILIVVVFLLMCLTLPETKNTSLAEAQRRFGRFFSLNVN